MDDNEYFIGNPGSQMEHWIQQNGPDNCAVAAETSIINQFIDNDLSIDDAGYISASNGWWQPGSGTNPDEIGNLMDVYGIENHTVMNASVEQLANELQNGHGVIVGVNSEELWDEGILNDIKQFFYKAFGLDNVDPADHAVVVTGIDVSNPENPMVIINDSGTPNGAAARYPLNDFVGAWGNSGFNYTATNSPIPNAHHPSPASQGFDVGDFLDIGTTLLTGSPQIGSLVNMVADTIDWDSVLQSI